MAIVYAYATSGAGGPELYPSQIDYTGRFDAASGTCTGSYNHVKIKVVRNFSSSYGQQVYVADHMIAQSANLESIETSSTTGLIKRYQLVYEAPAPATGRTRLSNVTECDSGGCVAGHTLPSTTFSWQNGSIGFTNTGSVTSGLVDANGSDCCRCTRSHPRARM